MKEYVVRLKDFQGHIIDGEIYKAVNMTQAKKLYEKRMKDCGIYKRPHDKICVSRYY